MKITRKLELLFFASRKRELEFLGWRKTKSK